jgi:hypothetical protein
MRFSVHTAPDQYLRPTGIGDLSQRLARRKPLMTGDHGIRNAVGRSKTSSCMIVEDRSLKNNGPSPSYTSPPDTMGGRAPSARGLLRAAINAPRAVLINIDPCFIKEMIWLSIALLFSLFRTGICKDKGKLQVTS